MSPARPPTIAVTVLYFAAAATETGLTAEEVERRELERERASRYAFSLVFSLLVY